MLFLVGPDFVLQFEDGTVLPAADASGTSFADVPEQERPSLVSAFCWRLRSKYGPTARIMTEDQVGRMSGHLSHLQATEAEAEAYHDDRAACLHHSKPLCLHF
jgi:hypothetical protein